MSAPPVADAYATRELAPAPRTCRRMLPPVIGLVIFCVILLAIPFLISSAVEDGNAYRQFVEGSTALYPIYFVLSGVALLVIVGGAIYVLLEGCCRCRRREEEEDDDDDNISSGGGDEEWVPVPTHEIQMETIVAQPTTTAKKD